MDRERRLKCIRMRIHISLLQHLCYAATTGALEEKGVLMALMGWDGMHECSQQEWREGMDRGEMNQMLRIMTRSEHADHTYTCEKKPSHSIRSPRLLVHPVSSIQHPPSAHAVFVQKPAADIIYFFWWSVGVAMVDVVPKRGCIRRLFNTLHSTGK